MTDIPHTRVIIYIKTSPPVYILIILHISWNKY